MTEIGKVIKAGGRYATVKVNKKDECSKCGMCLFPKNADSVKFCSLNEIGAKEGDEVVIKTSEKAKLTGVFLAFCVPLILLAISLVIGYLLIEEEKYILLISLSAVVLWYILLPFIDKKIKSKPAFLTEIIEIKGE